MKIVPPIPGSPLSPASTAAAPSPTLGGNLVSMVNAAVVVPPGSVQDFQGLVIRWVAANLRGIAPTIHQKTAPQVPEDEWWQHFYKTVTAGVESIPIPPPNPEDLRDVKKYSEVFVGVLLQELIRLAAPYCIWQNKIDQAVAEMAKAPLGDNFSIKDWIRIPLDLAESSLPDDQKIGLLTHARTQLERLPDADAIRGVPLLAAVIVAAYRLKDSKLVQEGFGLLEIVVEASTVPLTYNDTFHVLKGAIEILSGNGSSGELIPRGLLILKEFLLNLLKVDRGEMQFGMLGEANRIASSLGDYPLAFHFAQRRVDVALYIIQKKLERSPTRRTTSYGGGLKALDASTADQVLSSRDATPDGAGHLVLDASTVIQVVSSPEDTFQYNPHSDLSRLGEAFKEAQLDPDLRKQLFEHAREATGLFVDDDGLKSRVLSYLKLLEERPGQ